MEEREVKNKETKREPQYRFKKGSIFERWESDGEDFIDFHLDDEEGKEDKKDDKD